MNLQQAQQPRSVANGFGRRRVEREIGNRLENKPESGKTNSGRLTNAGVPTGSKGGVYESPSRERLFYLMTSLIGHHVEVQVKDGSSFSGIFHATSAENDFGVILKMACSLRDGSLPGQKAMSDSVSKNPIKTLVISSKEFVQITAKDVSITRDGLSELHHVKPQDIMLDSTISQSRHVELERELERWVPDEDCPNPESENIFDDHWKRGWDQFEVNETLFGVTSTFDEELYTTKLEKGPQMRDLEKEALRIAREIEGEDTQDLHLAEERGIQLHESFDIDEETRFSSVFRGVDDSGYDEDEDILLNAHNNETFGGTSDSDMTVSFTDLISGRSSDGALLSSSSSSLVEVQCFRSGNHARQLSSEPLSKKFPPSNGGSRVKENQFAVEDTGNNNTKEYVEKKMLGDEAHKFKADGSLSSVRSSKNGSDKGGLSPDATAYSPSSQGPSKAHDKLTSHEEPPVDVIAVKSQGAMQSGNSRGQPNNSASSTSDCRRPPSASAGPGLSPSSSVGSLSSEKSTLNPHAKEFKFNPNAKSFVPSQTPLRPVSPVADSSLYFPPNVGAVSHMHGMPVGVGMGPSYAGHQSVIFNPQAAPMQSPQAYFHPNGPQYGQQMILGHPRNVLYMQTYPPEMPYKGRDF